MRKYTLLALVPLVFFLDRLTKVLIINNLALFENVNVTSFFSLVHVRNFGGAFSFLHDYQYAQYVFTILPVLIAAGLLYVILAYTFSTIKTLSLILILAGALGNIYDRISYGNVVDFLDFYYKTYHWPAFNVADISVSCGIGLWIYAELFQAKKEPGNATENGK
jgi:signal peptidase II